jgi:parallel beta-helix repeat protein
VNADLSTFRDLYVTWDAGSVTTNGAYAIYPNNCARTLVEDCEVIGASDAGLYVGQCEGAIVRRNVVHGNVAGIEVENTRNADVYENEAYDNTAGILVLQEPHLAIPESRYVLVRDNHVHDNNRANFATPGTTVSVVPPGVGSLILAGKDTEIRNNIYADNHSTAFLVVSHGVLAILSGEEEDPDPSTDPWVERLYIHDNELTNNGTMPLGTANIIGQSALENVLWDGLLREVDHDPQICLGDPVQTSFRMIAAEDGFIVDDQSTDTTDRACTLTALPTIETF